MRAAPRALRSAVVVPAAVLLAVATLSVADPQNCGTIDTTDASVAAGTAPTQGVVTIDACAREVAPLAVPDIGTIRGIGTFTAEPPGVQEHPGTEEDGAYVATTGQSLAAGTYHFSSFDVPEGVTMTIRTPSTITTTGDFTVTGKVSVASGGSLTVNALGSIVVSHAAGAPYDAYIQTQSAVPLTFHVGHEFRVGPYGFVEAYDGALSIFAHGAPPESGRVSVQGRGGWLYAWRKPLTIHATGDVTLDYSQTDESSYVVRSFGGDVVVPDSGQIGVRDGTDSPHELLIEAAGDVRVGMEAWLGSSDSPVRISAFGGDVTCDGWIEADDRRGPSEGTSWIRAAGSISATENARIDLESADVEVVAAGGDVDAAGSRFHLRGDTVAVHAAGSVRLEQTENSTNLLADTGPLEIRAFGGDLDLSDAGTLWVLGGDGALVLQATGAVRGACGEWGADSAPARVYAGTGGISLDPCYARTEGTDSQDIAMVAEGRVTLRRHSGHSTDVRGRGVLVASTSSYVDVHGCVIESLGETGRASGDVRVESWAGSAGTVDANDAAIESGPSDVRSGDVLLRVVRASGGAPRDAFLVPTAVRARSNAKFPERSVVAASGLYDVGTTAVDLTGPVTLRLGTLELELPGLTTRNGRTFRHREGGLDLLVKGDPAATSRATFRLSRTGDLAGVLDPDGVLPLGIECGPSDAACAVRLVGGGHSLGRVRGALGEPPLRVMKASAALKGPGKDSLSLDLGLAVSTVTPAAASDVTLSLGDAWEVVIPGDGLVRRRDRFTWRGDVAGVRSVTLDYRRERLIVKGRAMDLGSVVAGDGTLTVRTTVDDEERAVVVRPRRKGASLRY